MQECNQLDVRAQMQTNHAYPISHELFFFLSALSFMILTSMSAMKFKP